MRRACLSCSEILLSVAVAASSKMLVTSWMLSPAIAEKFTSRPDERGQER